MTPSGGCLWLQSWERDNPMVPGSTEAFCAAVPARVEIVPLQAWHDGRAGPHVLADEIAAVQRAAAALGWARYDVLGNSAGGSAALACALAMPAAVRTVAVFEPWTIGDDYWSRAEADWRRQLQAIRTLRGSSRTAAVRRFCLAPGRRVQLDIAAIHPWDTRADSVDAMLRRTGFTSADLAALTQPTLVMSRQLSNPRFTDVAERLADVIPNARSVCFAECSHLTLPHEFAAAELVRELTALWRP